ncbi:hypothetical protein EUX98_g940 [Antrodiella citrinella]|uniref:CBM-cenC domain-containing protein n=1 Tax=Antrodiella citrinella TaxID=2447956 RepID=A0A4S4N2V7_9APHY|nr:hypothetical protein EUX98_g940 [Antrodiella citrinella]
MAFLRTLILAAVAAVATANTVIYSGQELLNGWQDASTYSVTNYTSGAISVASQPYGSFAVKNPAIPTLSSYAGIQLDIKGDLTYLYASLQTTHDNLNSNGLLIDVDALNANTFTTVLVNFTTLPLTEGPWNSISFQVADDPSYYQIDNIILLNVRA